MCPPGIMDCRRCSLESPSDFDLGKTWGKFMVLIRISVWQLESSEGEDMRLTSLPVKDELRIRHVYLYREVG